MTTLTATHTAFLTDDTQHVSGIDRGQLSEPPGTISSDTSVTRHRFRQGGKNELGDLVWLAHIANLTTRNHG